MKHFQNNPTESLCFYCGKSCDLKKCNQRYFATTPEIIKKNKCVFECPYFEQDIPFPMKWKEIFEKAELPSYTHKNNIGYMLNSYVRLRLKYQELHYKLLKFAKWARYRKPLEYMHLTPEEFLERLFYKKINTIENENDKQRKGNKVE